MVEWKDGDKDRRNTDRAAAAEQLDFVKQQYNQGRKDKMNKSIASMVGMGIGALAALPTGGMSVGAGAILGGIGGGAGADAFGFFMD